MIHETGVINDMVVGNSGVIRLTLDGHQGQYYIIVRRDKSGRKKIRIVPRSEVKAGEEIKVCGEKDFSLRLYDKKITDVELESFLNLLVEKSKENPFSLLLNRIKTSFAGIFGS